MCVCVPFRIQVFCDGIWRPQLYLYDRKQAGTLWNGIGLMNHPEAPPLI